MAVTQESKSYCEFFVKTYIVTNTDNDIIGLPSTTVINRPAKLQISEKKTQIKGYYAVQSHSRSSISVSIESPYATSY